MAQRTIIVSTCDLCGSQGATEVSLGGGRVVDLCTSHEELYREQNAPYLAVSRRANNAKLPVARPHSGPDQGLVREWAKRNGHTVSDRGRVSKDLIAMYQADANG